ncbi:MAG: LysR family transcriptional regulator [Bacillaceae bacterium]|nr:LysR family transcriptional regulator [Bacillaceae bacterium]
MNFNHLRVFYVVAESQNFSHAAEKLEISQPAVSTQIRKLEETLGVPLVENYGRKLKLTEAGRILKEYADRIFVLSHEAEQALKEIRGLEKGELLVGASTTPGAYILPAYIGKYKKMYPGINLSLKISNTQDVLHQLKKGELDLGFIGHAQAHPDLVLKPWKTDRLVLIVYPDHPLAGRDEVELGELEGESFILREPGSSTRRMLENRLSESGINIEIGLELDNTEAVKLAVASGTGISVVSEYMVKRETDLHLRQIRIRDAELKRTLHIAYHVGKRHANAARVFLEMIEAEKDAEPLT